MKLQRGTLYSTDEKVVLLKPFNGKEFSLAELQEAVGGYIENVIPLNRESQVFVNEEGLIGPNAPLPRNPHTHAVVDAHRYGQGFYVVGNMISVYHITKAEQHEDKGRVTVREALREIQSFLLHS